MLRSLAFSVIFYVCSVASTNQTYRVVSPAHLTQIPNVVVYEGTSQLVFTAYFPSIQRPSKTSLNATGALLNILLDDSRSELQIANKHSLQRNKRNAAAAAIGGGAILLVGGVTIGLLYSDLRNVKEYVDELRSTVVTYEQDLKVITVELQQFGGNITGLMEHYQFQNDRRLLEVLQVLEAKVVRDSILEAREACAVQRIPSAFVPISELQRQVSDLDEKLRLRNKTVAIPSNDISILYNAAVANCLFTDESITVIVTVPITKLGNSWKLYQVIPIKFAYMGQTCALNPNEPKLVAVSLSKVVEILPIMHNLCNFQRDLLCFVPEFQNDASPSVKCAVGLASKINFERLRQVCSFGCTDDTEVSIQQVGYYEYIIANADRVEVMCDLETTSYNFSPIGAVYVHTRCNCSLLVNGQHEIDHPLFCEPSADTNFIHAITPSLWTKFASLISWEDKFYTSSSSIDTEWHKKIPKLNLSQVQFPHIPEPPVLSVFSFTHLALLIMACVIVLQAVIVTVLCVACLKSGC